MKYSIIPESLAERLAVWAGKVPFPVLDTLLPLVKARSIMAAERLGLFEALRGGPLSPADLAGRLDLDEDSLRLVLRLLVASGYVAGGADRYRLSAMARRTVLRGGAQEVLGFLRFSYAMWKAVEHLEDLLRSGHGLDLHSSMEDREDWENYQRAMLELARAHAPFLARHVPVRPGATQLLDLAGAHGVLGAAICRRHPPMRSRVLELPAALGPARRLAREELVDDVVEHVAGDVRQDELGSDVDVVLAANILHHFSPGENVALLGRARQALVPGGTLAIWDIERRPEGTRAELGREAIALFFRITSASRCFTATEFRGWLAAAGFARVRVLRSPLAPLYVLVLARTQAVGGRRSSTGSPGSAAR